MTSKTVAASATVRVIGPIVSWKITRYDEPVRGTTPGVLRTPTRLQNDDGSRIEPPQSVPMPTAPRLAATAAPVPALEPPGSWSSAYGFFVSLLTDEYENHDVAKSGSVVFARMIAPASRSLRTMTASRSGV